jgi:hypothetical protein
MKKKNKEGKLIKAEELNVILDRTIGFVENCDTKASIVLALFGVILTVICASNITNSIVNIADKVKENINGGGCLYILCVMVAVLLVTISIIELLLVIGAKIDKTGLDSKIYFKDISENVNCCTYGNKIKELSEDSYIDDIITQIYINAQICTKKYERYNVAIKFGAVGTIMFAILYFIGIFIYYR